LNGDKTPCKHRLFFGETEQVKKQDLDIWQEYQKGLNCEFPALNRGRDFLYDCNAWMGQFFISPYGRLKFCIFSEKFSVDLKTRSFKEGFYGVFPRILEEKFKTNSPCINCRLRPVCYRCPARAYLETGDEEAAVPYYCALARAMEKEMRRAKLEAASPQPV
jgi:radical SAM protein with 4Fe4S-binding SPASM domain